MCLKTYPCKAGVDDDVGLGRLRRPRPSLSDTFRIGPKRLMPTRDINRRTSPPTSVGARAVGSGREGLYGRPRPCSSGSNLAGT